MAGACGVGAVTTGGGRMRAIVLGGLGGDGSDACVCGGDAAGGGAGGAASRTCKRSVS
jgi:hypothetical protein